MSDFASAIRRLRDARDLSQQKVADGVGLARATYVKIELGDREPKLDEIRSLSKFYEVSVGSLIDNRVDVVQEPTASYEFSSNDEIIPRDISPEIDPDKLRETLAYVLERVGAKPNVGETVLYKLLYFIDFDYYEKYGQSITGLEYIHNRYGPSPTISFKQVVEGMEANGELDVATTKYFNNTQRKYLPVKRIELEKLSAKELDHINDVLNRLSDKSASELSWLSHHDTPWVVTKQGQPLDYRNVAYRTKITAVTESEDEL